MIKIRGQFSKKENGKSEEEGLSGAAARTGNLREKMRKNLYKKEIGGLYEKQTRKKTAR